MAQQRHKLRLRETALAILQSTFMEHVDVPPQRDSRHRHVCVFFFHLQTVFHTGYVDMFIDYHCNSMT